MKTPLENLYNKSIQHRDNLVKKDILFLDYLKTKCELLLVGKCFYLESYYFKIERINLVEGILGDYDVNIACFFSDICSSHYTDEYIIKLESISFFKKISEEKFLEYYNSEKE